MSLATRPLAVPAGTSQLFSVDVEDYFQVVALEAAAPRASWDALPSRVEANTHRLLDLLARRDIRGTFFTLGWVAERYPELVRRIARGGHEVASHGHWHRRVTTLTPAEFRADLRESKRRLEDLSGHPCLGFRAPSFSIVPGVEWALDILVEEGFRYDSSLFPIHRPDYGYPGVPHVPFLIDRPGGTLLEIPLATRGVTGLRLPAAGGGYLRHFPLSLVRGALRQSREQRLPGMFYIHPWEYDPGQPRLPCGWLTARRHYRNLHKTWPRMEALVEEFEFTSVRERFAFWLGPVQAGTA